MMTKRIVNADNKNVEILKDKSKDKTEDKVESKTEAALPVKAVDASKYDFPVGAQFIINETKWTVRKAMSSDNADLRLITSGYTEETIPLASLRKDASEDVNFKIL